MLGTSWSDCWDDNDNSRAHIAVTSYCRIESLCHGIMAISSDRETKKLREDNSNSNDQLHGEAVEARYGNVSQEHMNR